MELFQAGTVEAYNILVDRYSERLMHYLYGFLGDKNAAKIFSRKHSFAFTATAIRISVLQNSLPGSIPSQGI